MNNFGLKKNSPLEKNYSYIILCTTIFSVLFIALLYKNQSGITYPIFALITMVYVSLVLFKMNVSIKGDSWIYMVAVTLLGVSIFMTDDGRIIFLNKLVMFVLVVSFTLHQYYDDNKWDFITYILNIFRAMFGCVSMADRIIEDGVTHYMPDKITRKKSGGKGKYVLLGFLISAPIVVFVLILLISADSLFSKAIWDFIKLEFFENYFVDINSIVVMFILVMGYTYTLMAYISSGLVKGDILKKSGEFEPTVGITIAGVLSFIYALFCGIQIRYLFMGMMNNNISLPYDVTYSEYARTGFFQLLFVSVLNMVIVLFSLYKFRKSNVLKGLLMFITMCTFVMIGSSASRMLIYIKFNYLTYLRIFVLWSLVVIALIMAGVAINILVKKFPMFKFSLFVVVLLYIIFSFIRPDAIVAKVNTDNMNKETQYSFFSDTPLYDDYEYLCELSADAAPYILDGVSPKDYEDIKETLKSLGYAYRYTPSNYEFENNKLLRDNWWCFYLAKHENTVNNMGIRDFNISRYQLSEYFD